jgi:hypothetical protein
MKTIFPILIALLVGVLAVYFNISYLGTGILIGVVISVLFRVERGSRKAVNTGVIMIAMALIGFVYSWYLSGEYHLSFVELAEHEELPEYVQAAPYFSVAFFTAGVMDLLHYVLIGKDKEKKK